jgi:tRNA nucleotidyltransferase/poly(A) polymerase
VDLVGGMKDLSNGITRMVGDAAERFDEDSLRILRAFRFASRYGHPLDSETIKAIEERKKIHPKSRLVNISPVSGVFEPVSQERIWEEFKKAFSQSKDFNHYLNFIDGFDMWNEMFPNCKINKEKIQSKNLVVVLANLLINENPKSLERKMVNDWRIEGGVSRKVTFLISFLGLEIENVSALYKQKVSSSIDNDTIQEWITVRGLFNPKFLAFLKFEPKVSGDELMKLGFTGSKLGEEIKRLQIEQFKKLL